MKNKINVIIADFKNPLHKKSYESLIDEYKSGKTGDGKKIAKAVKSRLTEDLSKFPSAEVYLAVFKGEFAGCATCFTGYSTFNGKKLINIHDLIVSEKFRRKGVGKALLRHIEGNAKKRGMCRLTLEVRSDNQPAIRLYSAAGFGPGRNIMYFFTKRIK